MDPNILEIFKTLGVAAPMVVLQFYLLRNCEEERKTISAGFLAELQLTLADNRKESTRMLDRQEDLIKLVMGVATSRPAPMTQQPTQQFQNPYQDQEPNNWRR